MSTHELARKWRSLRQLEENLFVGLDAFVLDTPCLVSPPLTVFRRHPW